MTRVNKKSRTPEKFDELRIVKATFFQKEEKNENNG